MDHFHLRNGELYAEDVPLARIAEEVGTPVYVYSRATLERHARVFREGLSGLDNPHIAYRVAELAPHIEGQEILIPPFIVGDFLEVVFIRKHGAIFEYMRYLKEGWFGN